MVLWLKKKFYKYKLIYNEKKRKCFFFYCFLLEFLFFFFVDWFGGVNLDMVVVKFVVLLFFVLVFIFSVFVDGGDELEVVDVVGFDGLFKI